MQCFAATEGWEQQEEREARNVSAGRHSAYMQVRTTWQRAVAGNEVSTSFQSRKLEHWLPLEKSKPHCFKEQNSPGANKGFGIELSPEKMLSKTLHPT